MPPEHPTSATLQREAFGVRLPQEIFSQVSRGEEVAAIPTAADVVTAITDEHYVDPTTLADAELDRYEAIHFAPEQRRWVRTRASGSRSELARERAGIKLSCDFPKLGDLRVSKSHRNLCLTPQYPLTKPQLELLRQERINTVHYPLKKRMLRLMHKSHWLAASANRWRYGMAAQLRLAFLEVLELGEYDALLLVEPDIVVFNPFRVLHLMATVAEPEHENGVWFTNDDYHFVHEGVLLFSRIIQSKSSPTPFLAMLRLLLRTPVTATSIGRRGRRVIDEDDTVDFYPRVDLHPGGSSLYHDNGIGAAILWFLFQKEKIMRPQVLDRCLWNYYLEYQMRTKSGPIVFQDEFYLSEKEETDGSGVLAEQNNASSMIFSSGDDGEDPQFRDSPRALVRQFYEQHFLRASRDLNAERRKYALLDAAELAFRGNVSPRAAYRAARRDARRRERIFSFVHLRTEREEPQGDNISEPLVPGRPGGEGKLDGGLADDEFGRDALGDELLFPPGLDWCAAAFVQPSVSEMEYTLCLDWPIENGLGPGLESRTDRCAGQNGPPVLIHKLEKDLKWYLDFFMEELNHCATFSVT